METIGLFQLENLMISRSPFVFVDLRVSREQVLPPPIQTCLRAAIAIEAAAAVTKLNELATDKTLPVLLIDETGSESHRVAARLEAAGYQNVYIIEGGVAGLLSEL